MNVLLVCQKFPPHYMAGAELQSLAIAKATRAHGIRTEVLTTSFKPGLPARETVEGIPVRRVRDATGRTLALSQFVATFRAAVVRADRYDVIDCQCVSPATLGAVAAARLRRRPVLLRPSLGGADGEVSKLLRSDIAGVLRRIIAGVDLFPVLDPAIFADLDRLGIPRERRRPVRNGVDLSRFGVPGDGEKHRLRAAYGWGDGPVALFAGQLIARKGLPAVLAVWPAVRRARPDAVLAVAGAGDLAPAVEAMAGDGVRFMGVRGDIPKLMKAADLVVQPSENESFGCVYAEAMASGLPVIAGDTGIASALAIDGRAGYQVAPGDRVMLRDRLAGLLCDPARRAEMGAEGVRMVQVYDMDTVAPQIVDLYHETVRLAQQRKGARR